MVRVEVAAFPLLRLIVADEKVQEIPGGIPLVGQARATGLDAVLTGVTVIVAVAELPAVIDEVGKFAERLKSGMFTATFKRAPL